MMLRLRKRRLSAQIQKRVVYRQLVQKLLSRLASARSSRCQERLVVRRACVNNVTS